MKLKCAEMKNDVGAKIAVAAEWKTAEMGETAKERVSPANTPLRQFVVRRIRYRRPNFGHWRHSSRSRKMGEGVGGRGKGGGPRGTEGGLDHARRAHVTIF